MDFEGNLQEQGLPPGTHRQVRSPSSNFSGRKSDDLLLQKPTKRLRMPNSLDISPSPTGAIAIVVVKVVKVIVMVVIVKGMVRATARTIGIIPVGGLCVCNCTGLMLVERRPTNSETCAVLKMRCGGLWNKDLKTSRA